MFLITHWVLQLFIETHKHKEKEVERKTEGVIDGKSEEETVMMWCVQDEVNQEEIKENEVDGMKKEAGYREAHNQNTTDATLPERINKNTTALHQFIINEYVVMLCYVQ